MTPLELMNLHLEVAFEYDARGRMLSTNEYARAPAPLFCMGRTVEGNLWRCRHDLDDDLAGALEAVAGEEPIVTDIAEPPRFAGEYRRLLAGVSPARAGGGPTYAAVKPIAVAGQATAIDRGNAGRLARYLSEWLPDVPHYRPMVATCVGGDAVAICASVRISGAAHEAGVETHAAFRRQGHAAVAVATWMEAVRRLGATPLYSTSWENRASQAVAARLECLRYGSTFTVS